MGIDVVCGSCPIWPLPTGGVTVGALVWTAFVSVVFTVFAILCWALMALPLARDLQRDTRRALAAWRQGTGAHTESNLISGTYDARWWGQAMLVLGALGTVAQYSLSHASYFYPIGSARYLVGLFLCMPLVAAPLVAGLRVGWRWAAGAFRPSSKPSSRPPSRLMLHWPPLIAVGASALLIALIWLNASGWQHAFADTSDRSAYGQPTSQRQAVLIAYLRERQITRFYTDYWTCYKVVFATDQQMSCAVFHNERVFDPGRIRLSDMNALVAATPHAPYVFDMSDPQQRDRADEFARAISSGDPRARGYTHTRVGEYAEHYTYTGG